MSIVTKTGTAEVSDDLEFVLSDATPDRYGDVVEAKGWDLAWFRKNPIALFGHDNDFPIGTWDNVRVDGGKLLGRLNLAEPGTSARIDELRSLVRQKILRAVSVGFKPIETEPNGKRGIRFLKQELLETSLVSVPANPAALAVARSMNLSADTMKLAFGEHAEGGRESVAAKSGEQATPQHHHVRSKMTNKTLSQRIEDAQADLIREKDALTAHLAEDDADPIVTGELSDRIEAKQANVDALKRAEQALAAKTAVPVEQRSVPGAARPATVAKKSEPKDILVRSAVCRLMAHFERRSAYEVMVERYGEDDTVKAMLDVVTKAATAPATTTTTGWAAELVQTSVLDFMESLKAASVYPALREKGGTFTFGRNGVVSIPSRNTGTSLAGSFVAQGAPIPVRQGAFTATTLTPKKMAVITTFTREIAEHSTPSIEAILRDAIRDDTAQAIDTILLDNVAASVTRPAGLRNGVTGATATAGGGFAALVGDLKALVGGLITSTNGNLRAPVFIMNPVQALSISLTQNAGGDFTFAAGIERGMLNGYPVIQSANVAAGTVFLVDAADFFTATGDEPRFDVSDQATLHMEDTTPAQIGTAGTPNVVAAPVRSMFQTDSIALRMILDMNWAMRRAGAVAFVTGVTW